MKREHDHFLKTERWFTPPEVKQVKGTLLPTLNPEPNPSKPALKGQVEKQAWVSPHDGRGVYVVDDSGSMTWNKLINDWFLEKGDAARSFDARHPITQDLMKDEGIKQARAWWEQNNRPHNSYTYKFNVPEYVRELVSADGTGSTLGTYGVYMSEDPSGKIRYDVYNDTDWESGTRMPRQLGTYEDPSIEDLLRKPDAFNGRIRSILNNRERNESGPGGEFRQHYYWYE